MDPGRSGALLLGTAVVPVLEFETDVPQFSEALYLPVLLAATLFAALILRQVLPGPLPVAGAVGIYVLLRVAIMLGLEGLGRSTPDLPLAIVGLAAVDLPWRTAAARYSGGAAAVALDRPGRQRHRAGQGSRRAGRRRGRPGAGRVPGGGGHPG